VRASEARSPTDPRRVQCGRCDPVAAADAKKLSQRFRGRSREGGGDLLAREHELAGPLSLIEDSGETRLDPRAIGGSRSAPGQQIHRLSFLSRSAWRVRASRRLRGRGGVAGAELLPAAGASECASAFCRVSRVASTGSGDERVMEAGSTQSRRCRTHNKVQGCQ
jgi:hypothetical protein